MVTTGIKYVAVLAVLCSGLALSAGDRQSNLEQEKQQLMREVEETKARIGQMRVEAMEHEAMAKQLAAEAAALELQMHQEIERRKRDLEMAGTEVEVDQMFAEAANLERHGHVDEAHTLRAKAEGVAEKLHAQRQALEERDLNRMDREIADLRAQSERAEREGRVEEAKQAWQQANQLSEELERHLEAREQREEIGHMHARLGELGRAIEEAQQKGQERAAEELRRAAEGLEREIHERERGMEMQNMEREIGRLHERAEQAEIRGRGDEADRLHEEAKHLERSLDNIARDRREDVENEEEHWDRDVREGQDRDEHEDENGSLRDEVNDLREQISHMRELMEKVLNRLK